MYGHYAPDPYGQRPSTEPPRAHYAYAHTDRTPSNDSSNYSQPRVGGYSSNAMGQGQTPNQHPTFHRAQSARQPDHRMLYRHSPSHSWSGSPMQHGAYSMMPNRQASVPERDENDIQKVQDYSELEQLGKLSLRDSGVGSDVGAGHTRSTSDTLRQTSASEYSTMNSQGSHVSRESSNSMRNQSATSSPRPNPKATNDDDMSPDSSDDEGESQSKSPPQSQLSRTASATHSITASGTSETIESADDMSRAMQAPEVVTNENKSMLTPSSARSFPHNERPSNLATVHPALRYPYHYFDPPASPEPDNVWLPLTRPAKHNNYHGFCKGAWQIRKSVRVFDKHQIVCRNGKLTVQQVQEGLSIQVIPGADGADIPHWACKLCDFRSKALNQNSLPDQIYYNTHSGVRYRWLFLAKSHIAAVGSL